MDSAWNVTPDDLYPATIYTLDGDGVADYQQDFTAGGQLDVLDNLFTTHAEYLGLTPTQIADATTSIDGNLTNIDISDNINGFDALIGALDNGIGSSGLFESLFSPCNVFDQHVLTRIVGMMQCAPMRLLAALDYRGPMRNHPATTEGMSRTSVRSGPRSR